MVVPIGALIGGGVSLINAMMGMGANRSAQNLSYMNLYEQKRAAREREKLAKADREDAYGNKVIFDGSGFRVKNTPLTAAILNSQQKEQLEQFRSDAPRDRDAANRLNERSKQADEVFKERFNDYRYKRTKSEGEYEAQQLQDTLKINKSRYSDEANQLIKAAMRTNNSGALKGIVNGLGKSNTSLTEAIINSRKEGKQNFLAERNASNQVDFGELGQLKSIADTTPQTQLNFGNENNALSGQANNALQSLISANMANSNAIGNATNSAASAAGKSFDLSGIANMFSKMDFSDGKTPEQRELEKLLMQQQTSNAKYGIEQNAYKTSNGIF